MRIKLQAVHDPDWVVQFDGVPVLVGREAHNQLVISDQSVSPTHAAINLKDGYLIVSDIGSAGGTTINGSPVQQAAFQAGDVLGFGDVQFQVLVADVPAGIPHPATTPVYEHDSVMPAPKKKRSPLVIAAMLVAVVVLVLGLALGLVVGLGVLDTGWLFGGQPASESAVEMEAVTQYADALVEENFPEYQDGDQVVSEWMGDDGKLGYVVSYSFPADEEIGPRALLIYYNMEEGTVMIEEMD